MVTWKIMETYYDHRNGCREEGHESDADMWAF